MFKLCSSAVLLASIVCPVAVHAAKPAYKYTGHVSFDLRKVPFTRYGSYMAFSMLTNMGSPQPMTGLFAPDKVPGLYLRNLYGGSGVLDLEHPVFHVELTSDGVPVSFKTEASPTVLRLVSPNGSAEVFFADDNRIRFRTHNVSLRLTPVGNEVVVAKGDSHWETFRQSKEAEKYTIWPSVGTLAVSGSWNGIETDNPIAQFEVDPKTHVSEGEIDTYESTWTAPSASGSFEAGLLAARAEYSQWLTTMPEVSAEFGPGAELAAYVDWGAMVSPRGFLDKPTMLMSKNWMAMVWSWDHCFNAMALSQKNPELAWQQFTVMFDNQESHGALPDEVRETIREYTYSKPPIHGWVLAWMMRHGSFDDTQHLAEIYGPLVRWTNWYTDYRDTNHNGLPEYDQGNDSGWDNSTVFLKGVPVEAPDLSSFLILQMDTLADLAGRLGKPEEAAQWRQESDTVLQKMLARFWRGDHFVAIRTENESTVEADSLLLYVPVILGKRLPVDIREKLVAGLLRKDHFRTANGFATEGLQSPSYSSDGYWRGPIWAPSSLLIADGLESMGEAQAARELRTDFCRMAQKSGMAENFNAVTGEGLRDPAYTWTSSTYLLFAHSLWQE